MIPLSLNLLGQPELEQPWMGVEPAPMPGLLHMSLAFLDFLSVSAHQFAVRHVEDVSSPEHSLYEIGSNVMATFAE